MNEATTATRSIVMEREVPHPPEKVWRALTQGALIEEWLMKNDFQPVVGHRFSLRGTPQPHWDGVVEGEVLEASPNKRVSYTWNGSYARGATGLRTVVTWTLAATKGGTLVRMEQSGFRPEDEGYRGASYGWQQIIGNLERVLATLR
jgi:uncharacterized protein YndB with AHSA1/START domain